MLSVYLSMVNTDEDNDKITFIYTTYYSSMAYSARSVLGNNKFDVDDTVHNAMLKIIEIIHKIDFSEPKRVEGLCCIIARNQAIDHCKHSDNQNISIDDAITEDADIESCPMDVLIRKETYNEILRAIYSLDVKYRDVCILKYLYKMKEKDIGTALGLPAGTVSVRIQRGRQILKKAIGKGDIK